MITAPPFGPKTSAGCRLTSSSQAGLVEGPSANSGGVTVWQLSFLAKNASRYDRLMLTMVPPSYARLKFPLATSSDPSLGCGTVPVGSSAIPVGKKSRVLLGPWGPNGGGRNSGGVPQAAERRSASSRGVFIGAAFL